jgi:hypothetical protein
LLLCAALALGPVLVASADGPPSVALAGSLSLPATATEGGPEITGLSGVTWLGDDRYAAILDNNYPGRFELTPREQFIRLWAGYGGFALSVLGEPTSSIPYLSYEVLQ